MSKIPKEEWQKRIEQWQASGKSCRKWCQDYQIPYTTFLGWRHRLKRLENQGSSFIELKNLPKQEVILTLECGGIRILLPHGCNDQLIKQCLSAMRSVLC